MIIDVGTGDGRAVLARAAAEPRSLVIGIDANADAMAESSRRAFRGRGRQTTRNSCFLVEAAESLPGVLAGTASLVTVTMPWGSLLRGVLGVDQLVLRGVSELVAPGGRVEVIASVVPSDNVAGLLVLNERTSPQIATAWAAVGFELVSMRWATAADLLAARSSWARRLGDRPAWRLDLTRETSRHPPPRVRRQDARH